MKKELVHPELPKSSIIIKEVLVDDNKTIEETKEIELPTDIVSEIIKIDNEQ